MPTLQLVMLFARLRLLGCKLLLCGILMQAIVEQVTAMPQDPFAMGLSLASSAAEMLQNGMVARKASNFDMPFGSMNSKTEAGMGRAIRPPSADSDEDSDEKRRRRKRSLATAELKKNVTLTANLARAHLLPAAQHMHVHLRGKRSPCRGGGGGTTDPTDDGDVVDDGADARKRRAQRQRNGKQKSGKNGNNAKSTTKSKNSRKVVSDVAIRAILRRKRRETELQDLAANNAAALGNEFNEQTKKFNENIQALWQSVTTTVQNFMQQMKQTFNAAGEPGIASKTNNN